MKSLTWEELWLRTPPDMKQPVTIFGMDIPTLAELRAYCLRFGEDPISPEHVKRAFKDLVRKVPERPHWAVEAGIDRRHLMRCPYQRPMNRSVGTS